ncbi:MAG: hypothetical protein LBM75_06095 [Myxococcales bacterium]|nr:hypothetical protein [Myxococcales bacterium]
MARRPKTASSPAPDPLAELRKNLENLDSIEEALGVATKGTEAIAPAPKPPPLPPSLPPQLPVSSAPPPSLSSQAPIKAAAAAFRPSDFLCPELPPPLPEPGDNPFGEQPETRMPRAAAPEEKVDFFRGVVKTKTEALARAKSLYGARVEESKRLREVIDALNAQLARIAPLQSLPKELDVLRGQLAEAELQAERVDEAESALDAMARRCVDLEQAIETFEIKLLKLQSQLKSEKQATNELSESNAQLQSALSDRDAHVGELETQLDEKEVELQAFVRLQADFAALEAKLAATEAQMELREAIQKKLEGDLDAAAAQLRQEKIDHEQQLSLQQRSSAQALSDQESRLDEARSRELEARRAQHEADCRVLQSRLDEGNAQLQLAREESEKLVVEREALREELTCQMSAQKKEAADQLAEALAQAEARRQAELAELQKALDVAKKEMARKLSEREQQLRQEFEEDMDLERRQGHEREQTLSEQYENEIKVLEAHLAKAQESLDKSRTELDATRDAVKQAEAGAIQKLALQRKELNQQNADVIAQAEAKHQQACVQLDQVNAELESSSAQNDALQAELVQVKAELTTLGEALTAARARASSLEIKTQQDSLSSAEQERALDSLKAELSLTREKLETSRQASAALRQENRRLQMEVSTQTQQARAQANQVEDSLSDAQEKARQFELKNGLLQRKLDSLTQELAESRAATSVEATHALEREVSARKAAEARARDLEKALTLATQTLREAARAGMTAPPTKMAK